MTDAIELPTEGARCGVVADLNGDGYDDLVVGMYYNGARKDLNACIYYGSPQGLGEARRQLLPAPVCTAVAAGDFDGDGRPDLAFLCAGKVRVFYQTIPAFEPRGFTDLEIAGEDLAAHDLDRDGYADLAVRQADGRVIVYWGGPGGITAGTGTVVPVAPEGTPAGPQTTSETSYLTFEEPMEDARPLVKVLQLGGTPHLFVARSEAAWLVPVTRDRTFGSPIVLAAGRPLAAAAGDADGDGYPDLVLACRELDGQRSRFMGTEGPGSGGAEHPESSWVYWGGPEGYSEARRTRLPSQRACDVALADPSAHSGQVLDGDGRDEILLCQHHDAESYTTHSLVYRVLPGREVVEAARLVTHDAAGF